MDSGNASGLADITIAGLGMVAVNQVTPEVTAVLRRSREILYLDHGFGVRPFLEDLCPAVTDLYPIGYRTDEPRIKAYDRMSATVLDAALDHAPVTFAIYGHPKVYVYPTAQIKAAAVHLDLTVDVLPGISSLDTMLIDLDLDPGLDGLLMYEATDLLLRRRPLLPDVPCLLWQVGAVESSLYSQDANRPERFARLQRYLLDYYPPDHRVKIVHSAGHRLLRSSVRELALSELPRVLAEASPVATLYLPCVQVRGIGDDALRDALESTAHLRSITHSGS